MISVAFKKIYGLATGMLLLIGTVPMFGQTPYLGEIRMFAGNFAPAGWAICDGSLLSINNNQALFALLGTMYGGDGITTFALPDLRGRVAVNAGQGVGLTSRSVGEMGGEEFHTLTVSEMPTHSHTMAADTTVGSSDRPANGVIARNAAGVPQYGTDQNAVMKTNTIGATGGGNSHNNMQPYTVVTFIIALQGVFPSQN